jgi:hypothetical protein
MIDSTPTRSTDQGRTELSRLRAEARALRTELITIADYHRPSADPVHTTGAACAVCGHLDPCRTRRLALRALGPTHRAGSDG